MRIKSLMLQFLLLIIVGPPVLSQDLKENPELDRKVKTFLEEKQYRWRDMNVPPGGIIVNITCMHFRKT